MAHAKLTFAQEAQRILSLPVTHRVNALGGYGADGEVIYDAHPCGCPSVLVDSRGAATVTFMSNGSLDFLVKLPAGMEVRVLTGSFEAVEKREIGVPSGNVWLSLADGKSQRAASLINPGQNAGLSAKSVRFVKQGDPNRSAWYGAQFEPTRGQSVRTAVRLGLVDTPAGPALTREIWVKNTGKKKLNATLWTHFDLHGTQRFVYNKPLWYDRGLPVNLNETIVATPVPYSDILQIKRVSTVLKNARAVDATCDYQTFVGDTSASVLLPGAVLKGGMLPGGAGRKLNRFSTASIAASQFAVSLAAGQEATIRQSLLYVLDDKIMGAFGKASSCENAAYGAASAAFKSAAAGLIRATPGAAKILGLGRSVGGELGGYFQISLPHQSAASQYGNSVWTGVQQLYENCRGQGAQLANGIELGTRDRAQDMWPKIKEDPGRVRTDLVHAMSFMYVTGEQAPVAGNKPLTLREKLHGMFPRQFPSRWDDRRQEVLNDNRPYTDSPLWLINSICMYIRETGDASVLSERVRTVRLSDPDHPEKSGIVGCDKEFTILDVMFEVFANFQRSVADTPYGLAQILYGEWCDPVDMFGTGVVGDAGTRGQGRGVHARLSAHLFECLVQTIDLCGVPVVAKLLDTLGRSGQVTGLQSLANTVRANLVRVAWEDVPSDKDFPAAFINCIHELRADGSRPDYAKGETGYTLGSMLGRDFDGVKRRELAGQAYCLPMLTAHRPYLTSIAGADEIVAKILRTVDRLFFSEKIGLTMFTVPIANSAAARALVGRMGIVPAGTAENGEYHHCQVMMHRFRMRLPGEADTAWRQFKPIMSAMRDETLCGPFETPSTSYASDEADPHFGKGMYFGLSGSVDWIVEIFHEMIGLELALHDPSRPAVRVSPNLPGQLNDAMTLRRVIHLAAAPGQYRQIPLTISVRRQGKGDRLERTLVAINGRPAERAEVKDLSGFTALNIELTRVYS